MSTFTEKEFDEAMEKGWIMFDMTCKPTGKSRISLRDKKTGMIYNPGTGWTMNQKVEGELRSVDLTERNSIRMVMMTDMISENTGTVYFFESILKDNREEWDMIGFYMFSNQRDKSNNRKRATALIDGNDIIKSTMDEFVSKVKERHQNIGEIKLVNRKFEFLADLEVEDEVSYLLLTALGQGNDASKLNGEGRFLKVLETLHKGEMSAGSMFQIGHFIWAIDIWMEQKGAFDVTRTLARNEYGEALRQIVFAKGKINADDLRDMDIEKFAKLCNSYKSTLKDIKEDSKSLLRVDSIIKLLLIYEMADGNDTASLIRAINETRIPSVNIGIKVIYDHIMEGRDIQTAVERYIDEYGHFARNKSTFTNIENKTVKS